MNNHTQLSDSSSDIRSQACSWIAQLETGDLTNEDLAAFKEWTSRSPVHREEIKRMAALSNEVNIIAEMAAPLQDAINQRKSMKSSPRAFVFPRKMALTSAFLMVLVFSSVLMMNIGLLTKSAPLLIITEVGSHREMLLEDGSTIQINTDSQVEIDFNEQRRKVRILKGEAFFQVAHNKNRPFIVYAGEKAVKAIGTAFLVRHLPDQFEVTVTEGRVELSQTATLVSSHRNKTASQEMFQAATQQSEVTIYIDAGESIRSAESATLKVALLEKSEISTSEINRKLSWQNGLFDFSDTPLREVIDDLSRYTQLKIKISDPELEQLKFGGLFRTDDIESLFDALESAYQIKVEYQANGVVKLSRVKT